MRSHTEYLTLNVPARMDFVNITGDVENAVAKSGVREGLCLVNAMHARSWWRSPRASSTSGPWEQIFYGEFDGRRPKKILIKVLGD